jgi:peptidoglycan-associated lipoprotein
MSPILFTLQGVITDDSTKKQLTGVLVQLVGSDGTSAKDTTDETGLYKFNNKTILANTSYELTFSKDGYFSKKGNESTVGLERSKGLVYDEVLIPIPKNPIELPEILYDLGRWELLPESQSALDGLILTMQDNPNIVVELGSHTDSRPIAITNDTLSQRRAQSVVDYLISKGIAADRLVAKGYAARVPKVLTKDVVRDGIKFKSGTVLTTEYINSLKTSKEREAAHQLNRRTEFIVIRIDYVSKDKSNTETPVKIEIIKPVDENNTDDTNKQEEEKE